MDLIELNLSMSSSTEYSLLKWSFTDENACPISNISSQPFTPQNAYSPGFRWNNNDILSSAEYPVTFSLTDLTMLYATYTWALMPPLNISLILHPFKSRASESKIAEACSAESFLRLAAAIIGPLSDSLSLPSF